jgi:hypothetical protein
MFPRLAAAALVVLVASAARAHDCVVACAAQPGHVELQLRTQFGRITRPGIAPTYRQLSLFASAAVGGGVTVSGMVSGYDIRSGGTDTTGIGDMSLGISRTVVRGDTTFYFAAATHLPTGSPEKSLGMGHPMGLVGAGGTWAPGGAFRFGLDLLDGLALTTADHQHTDVLVNPHSMHELFYETWTSWSRGPLTLRAAIASQTALASEDDLKSAFTPVASASYAFGGAWQVQADVMAPSFGQHYFGWQAGISIARALGGAACWRGAP